MENQGVIMKKKAENIRRMVQMVILRFCVDLSKIGRHTVSRAKF